MFTSAAACGSRCRPRWRPRTLRRGQAVRLNEALTVVEAGGFERIGEVCALREVLADDDEPEAGRS